MEGLCYTKLEISLFKLHFPNNCPYENEFWRICEVLRNTGYFPFKKIITAYKYLLKNNNLNYRFGIDLQII